MPRSINYNAQTPSIYPVKKVHVFTRPVDMRYWIDSLYRLIKKHYGRDPYSGEYFMFIGKDGRKMKVLVKFRDVGFMLYYVRLNRPFRFDSLNSRKSRSLDWTESEFNNFLRAPAIRSIGHK